MSSLCIASSNNHLFNEFLQWEASMPTLSLFTNKSGILHMKYFENVNGVDYLVLYAYDIPICFRKWEPNTPSFGKEVYIIYLSYNFEAALLPIRKNTIINRQYISKLEHKILTEYNIDQKEKKVYDRDNDICHIFANHNEVLDI
jgi:hypothetical protein